MKKILYIILDGLADSPILAFRGMTPLEAALTPHLDRLAQKVLPEWYVPGRRASGFSPTWQ